MNALLKAESEKLARSWLQHEAGWLREYLVAGVEDPRVNLQSILSRHFLIRAARGATMAALMEEEIRFSAVMNWLLALAGKCHDAEDLELVLFALRGGSDNVEGIPIPAWVTEVFASLPAGIGNLEIPNYVESFLRGTRFDGGKAVPHEESLVTFAELWRAALKPQDGVAAPDFKRLSVLEPACGSANDYRFFEAYGLASLLDYTGLDLCPANISNARALFPAIRFETGNVFEIAAPDRSFDCCVVHDLFEHLSPVGMETAVREICRVTRRGICAGFFQMDERSENLIRPVEDYHWSLLSVARTRELFAVFGFTAQVLHIGTFLRHQTGSDEFHNPNAYTFRLRAAETAG